MLWTSLMWDFDWRVKYLPFVPWPPLFWTAEMNRHHYSLYVHNCRLILLLRQEPSEAENYKPAEFHWKLDQVSHHCSRHGQNCRLQTNAGSDLSSPPFVIRCVTKSGITMWWMWSSPLWLSLLMELCLSHSWWQRTTHCTPPKSKLSLPSVPAGKVKPWAHLFSSTSNCPLWQNLLYHC